MTPAILQYLRARQAAVKNERDWLKERIELGIDLQPEDYQILQSLCQEVAHLDLLISGRIQSVMYH